MPEMEFTVLVHEEDGSYWAEVKELPGCFASGFDLDELKEAVVEAINMCVTRKDLEAAALPLPSMRVDEMKLTPA